jgi:hypothetical protein
MENYRKLDLNQHFCTMFPSFSQKTLDFCHFSPVPPAFVAAPAAAAPGVVGSRRSPGGGGRSTWLQPGRRRGARPLEKKY